MVRPPLGGGQFEYVPMLRSADNENLEGVRRLLQGDRSGIRSMSGGAGTLALFRGHFSPHRVTTVTGPRPRIIAVLSYASTPDARLSGHVRQLFLDDPFHGRGELRAVGRVALLQAVIGDDPVVVVGDLGLVAELHGLAEPALGDRPGIPVMQADPPGRPVRHLPRPPLPALPPALPRPFQQPGQAADRPARAPPPPPSCGVLKPRHG